MGAIDYRKYKLLFVDDELTNLENLVFAFGVDFSLVTASSGGEALALVEQGDIAVVLADQRMPGMTGVELLSVMKEKYPRVVRILITAYADITAAVDAINKGDVYRYVGKDLPMEEIETIIRQAIEYYKIKEDLEIATKGMIQSEKLTTIAEMSAGIAHEIKNTITGTILGLQQLNLMAKEMGLADEGFLEILKGATEYAGRSRDLVERLNDFARPGSVEMLDPGKIVSSSVKMARHGLKTMLSNIEIIQEVNGSLPSVEGNSTALEMVFLNLVRNAAQAMDGDPGKIVISGRDGDGWVYLSVHDTGPGIPKEHLEKVLGAFYTTKKDGMGIGLYVIEQVLTALGGRLELESEPGQGATFTVVLPAKD